MITNNLWLLSGEMGEVVGAYETELLAEQAAWEYSEHDSFGKEQTIAWMECNTEVNHIEDVFGQACEKNQILGRKFLNDIEEYAIKNYKKG